MKRTAFFALVAALGLAIGCATNASLPEKMDDFVEKTAEESKNYTTEDWEKSRESYEALVQEYNENSDSYTPEEKSKAIQAMARYNALLIENGIASASESLGEILDQIPQVLNEIIEKIDTNAIKNTVNDFTSTLEGLVNSIDTAAIRESVEGIVNAVDTARLRKSIEGITQSIDTASLRKKVESIGRSIDPGKIEKTLEDFLNLLGAE